MRPAVVALALAGCVQFDPAKEIELVVDPAWAPGQVAALGAAGQCWNLAFGMHFAIVPTPTTDQSVYVQFNDFACLGGFGLFSPGTPARIDICPAGHEQHPVGYPVPVFVIVEHELGHAAGIRSEGTGPSSVMGGNFQSYEATLSAFIDPSPAFSDEDRQIVHDQDPDFVPAPTCANVDIGYDPMSEASCRCF